MMSTERDQELFAKLSGETARIGWEELQRFFANGSMIRVRVGLDLVEVAYAFASDNKAEVERLLAAGDAAPPSDAEALAWHELQAEFWAVVVAPWVLVQERREGSH